MAEKFEYGKHKSYELWYFQLKSPKGNLVIQSDTFDSKESCIDTINNIKKYAQSAEIVRKDNIEQGR
jgi:uncharacterized protein YegP (UPF0339 family)